MNKKNKNGFIAFTSLLVVSAVILTIALSIPLLAVTQANTSLGTAKGAEALKLAEGCADEALLRLRDSVTYTGGTLTYGGGSCTIAVSGSGSDRTIDIDATVSVPPDYVKHLQITVKRTGNSINILTWQEVE
ncbi:hypothetical protein KA017_01575 [Candidatus Woesebacteria bacterium]|nr:hypothetical protein [Candidatus Woesebacteria bacterium]